MVPVNLQPPRLVSLGPLLIAGIGRRFASNDFAGIPALWQELQPHFGQNTGPEGQDGLWSGRQHGDSRRILFLSRRGRSIGYFRSRPQFYGRQASRPALGCISARRTRHHDRQHNSCRLRAGAPSCRACGRRHARPARTVRREFRRVERRGRVRDLGSREVKLREVWRCPLRSSLVRSPSRRGMAAICAKGTAGVDVKRDIADRGDASAGPRSSKRPTEDALEFQFGFIRTPSPPSRPRDEQHRLVPFGADGLSALAFNPASDARLYKREVSPQTGAAGGGELAISRRSNSASNFPAPQPSPPWPVFSPCRMLTRFSSRIRSSSRIDRPAACLSD